MIELKQTQRYFHFIALSGSPSDRIRSGFYGDQNIERTRPEKLGNCTLQRLRVNADYQYFRGVLDENADQLVFDGVLLNHKDLNLSVLGFPFKKMMANMVSRLIDKFSLESSGNFVNVDMRKLILVHDKQPDQPYGDSEFFLAGVDLAVSGDRFLSTVKLQGDRPLESGLYTEYFRPKVRTKNSRLEKCTMKCKINQDSEPRVVSSIHIDKFGNFKLYVHADGRNLQTLPIIFEFLDSIGCLSSTPHAPTLNIFEDDE